VTLGDVSGSNLNVTGMPGTWGFRFVIEGAHIPGDQLMFDRLRFSTDRLWEWATPPPIAALESDRGPAYRFPYHTSVSCEMDGASVRLASRPAMTVTDREIDGQLVAVWEVDLRTPLPLREALDAWVNPLRELVSLLSSRPNRITWLRGGGPATHDCNEIRTWVVGDDMPPDETPLRPGDQLAPLRWIEDPCGLITSWFTDLGRFRTARARLLNLGFFPLLFEEQRVTAIAQAAEAIHTLLWNRPETPEDEHAARVEAVVSAAPKKHQAWARKKLQDANGLSLAVRIAEIVVKATEAGMPFCPPDPAAFASEITKARNPPSHGRRLYRHGNLEEVEHVYLLFRGLEWMLRVILVSQLGLPPAFVRARMLGQSEFLDLASHLGWESPPPPAEA
jgi:hypothetical protein